MSSDAFQMSTNPTRVEWEKPLDPALAVAHGNVVLDSIGRQEGLRALLAFSDLHEQIRGRRTDSSFSENDLFQTERFVLDEVLQLICSRALSLTQADAIVLALAEGPELVCRAGAGSLPIVHGTCLKRESKLLADCLATGKIVRCDDSATDFRAVHDFSREIQAHSTVVVPLSGHGSCFGVLQAFSLRPWAFTDEDVRCFDLFAELVLSAIKPDDQDRRFLWLSEVADDLLQTKHTLAALPETIVEIPLEPAEEAEVTQPVAAVAIKEAEPPPAPNAAAAPVLQQAAQSEHVVEVEHWTQPVVIPVAAIEVPEPAFSEPETERSEEAWEPLPAVLQELPATLPRRNILARLVSSPGLSVVAGLVAVAALFSAGVWWGMQVHGKTAATRGTGTARSVTAPGAPVEDVLAPPPIDAMALPAQSASGAAPISDSKLAALPKITGVRHWASSMGTTVVIDMEDQVPYEVHRLMSPERIYFDLHDTAVAPDLNGATMDIGDASLSRVRIAQPVAGITRIVLDTKDGSNFAVSMEANPYRLIVELRDNVKVAAETQPNLGTAAKAAPVAALTAKTSAPPLPVKTGKYRIVLDAGHGGWDLGTVGREGLLEKNLVLDVTRRLSKLLQTKLGAEVVLTRAGDDYLPLEQRSDLANQSQADLFVSVHANYSNSENARGVETYYTNLFSAPGSRETDRQNSGSAPKLLPVALSSTEVREKTAESRRLAMTVQRALFGALASKSADIRNRGIKDAAFAVLTGTTMPSILTEISFVSSPQDERNLQSETYRQQIAEALYKGIANYEQASPKAKVAQLHGGEGRRVAAGR